MATLRASDDLFERSTMPFGEHLEQLRAALVKSSLWLALGTSIGFYFSEYLVDRMAAPFRQQLREYHVDRFAINFQRVTGTQPPKFFSDFMRHQQVIPRSGYVLTGSGLDEPLDFESTGQSPKHQWLAALAEGKVSGLKRQVWLEPIPDNLTSIGIFEGFFVYFQASLVVGVTVALPGMFWHVWSFVAAGLYPHERRYVYRLLPLSVGLFVAGAAVAYFVMIDLLIGEMLQYNLGLDIEIQPRLKDCFSLAMWMPLVFGLCFQLPLVMVVLVALQLVTPQTFLAQQRIALLAITLLSMVLTPADPYTFLGLMIPLVMLYYVGVALCWKGPRAR